MSDCCNNPCHEIDRSLGTICTNCCSLLNDIMFEEPYRSEFSAFETNNQQFKRFLERTSHLKDPVVKDKLEILFNLLLSDFNDRRENKNFPNMDTVIHCLLMHLREYELAKDYKVLKTLTKKQQ